MLPTKRVDASSEGAETSEPHPSKHARHSPSDEKRPDDWIFGAALQTSEMCRLLREHDFSQTALGPMSSWPLCVKTALSLCLNSHFGIVLWLGKDFQCVYNDAFRASCGNKHPSKLGRPGAEYWTEMWDVLLPMLQGVVRTGVATWMVDHHLPAIRLGYVEETYWTYSYSPIIAPDGSVHGVFTATEETTRRVVGDRRLRTLRELSASLSHVESVAQVCRVTSETLARNRHDAPFMALYTFDAKERVLRLRSSFAITPGRALDEPWPPEISYDGNESCAASRALRTLATVIEPMKEEYVKNVGLLPPWNDTPREIAIIPLRTHEKGDEGGQGVQGVLVLGLNTHRAVDDNYRTFLSLAGAQIASSLATARAFEEEKRRAQALAELDRAKTTFFSNISHEFRTPLALMIGPLEDMLYNPTSAQNLTEAQRVSLSLVHRNGSRLLKLVNMLLDFSRIEAGRMQASFRPVDLPSLVSELASLFRSACDKAGLRLIVNCPPDALAGHSVFCDIDMFEKIIVNLLSNAFKYTLKGEIEVRVELDAAHDAARVVVRDTGCGIPANEMPRLFERFHRVHSSYGRTHEGTGIGLAFVQELVKLHGGSIQVHSTPGHGSTFTVSIPCGSAHLPPDSVLPFSSSNNPNRPRPSRDWWLQTEPATPDAAPSPSSSSISSPSPVVAALAPPPVAFAAHLLPTGKRSSAEFVRARVLVADDNDDMRGYLCRILAGAGQYEIFEARDGQHAFELLQNMQPKPELVISDIMMPRLDGYGLLKAMREHKSELMRVPVMFLSARAGEEARMEGMAAGADDYLAKPFSSKELLARVAARIELYRQHREATRREEKLRREAEEANAVKDRFLAVLSHELRTPLTPALLLAEEYLFNPNTLPSVAEDMAIISRQIRLQVQLIDDLLDVTKIRQGKLRLQLQPVDAHVLIRHTLDMFDRQVTEKKLTIDVQLKASKTIAPADSTRLQQIFWNLIGNAVKFSHQAGRITVVTANDANRSHLTVAIKDEGIGIEPSALPKLFNAFEQTSQEITRSFGGLGLGLVISRTLAVLHGGSLEAASDGRDKGATFTLTLPTLDDAAVAALANSPTPPTVLRTPTVTAKSRLRLLLVEDNATTVLVMERLLRRLGHEVLIAASCDEARRVAGKKDVQFDLLLCDIGLPDGNGHALLRQLRPLQPKMRAIALSGFGREEEVKRSYDAGFSLHLTKPVRLAQVSDAINQVMAADFR